MIEGQEDIHNYAYIRHYKVIECPKRGFWAKIFCRPRKWGVHDIKGDYNVYFGYKSRVEAEKLCLKLENFRRADQFKLGVDGNDRHWILEKSYPNTKRGVGTVMGRDRNGVAYTKITYKGHPIFDLVPAIIVEKIKLGMSSQQEAETTLHRVKRAGEIDKNSMKLKVIN